jgi:cyclase
VNQYQLAQGVYAFVDPERGFGHANVGLVIDGDGLTVIDTTATPRRGRAVRDAIWELTEPLGLRIKRIVVTSSRIPFAGGTNAFWPGAYYGTDQTSDELDAPVNLVALARLLPEFAAEYDADFTTRPITHTIAESAWLTPSCQVVPAPGESDANTIVVAPESGIVFAGALASFGVTPLAFDGDPAAWVDSLAQIREVATTVVPGHGAPGGRADLDELIGYLRAVVAVDGDASALPPGPWDDWTNREFDPVNVERAARLRRGDRAIPTAMFELLGFAPPDQD